MKTTLQKLSENVWAIDQEMVRSFLIVGEEKAALLDSGSEPCELLELIRSVTEKPVTLIQTHGDGDHTANSALFPEIYAHPAETEGILQFRPELEGRLVPVSEGELFELGGCTLEVIHAPGHTPGSICLLDREHRALYSGDTVSYGPVFLFGARRDIRVFRKTLEKLQALDGYDTVYPCHNTCPISPDTIGDLIAAVDGTLDGSISGTEMPGPPMPDGARPLCYSYGMSGILYIK